MLRKIDFILEDLGIYNLLGFCSSLIPKNKDIFIWTSYPNYSDSVRIFYEYCKEIYPDKRHIWIQYRRPLLMNISELESYDFYSLLGLYYVLKAKVIFTNNNEFYRIKSRNQILIDFWHGIPIKSILNYDRNMTKKHRTFASTTTYRVSSSRFVTIMLSSAFGNSPFSYLETGSLRADRLLSASSFDFYRLLPGLRTDLKIAVLMPTYRKGYDGRDDGDVYLDGVALAQMRTTLLNNGYNLVVKPHPFEEHKWTNLYPYVITSKTLDSFNCIPSDLLASTDLLITDYSSVLLDFLLLRRPFIVLNIDQSEYNEKRGFIFEVGDYLNSNVLKNLDDFDDRIHSILNAKTQENIEFLTKLYFDYHDTDNAKRLSIRLAELHNDVF